MIVTISTVMYLRYLNKLFFEEMEMYLSELTLKATSAFNKQIDEDIELLEMTAKLLGGYGGFNEKHLIRYAQLEENKNAFKRMRIIFSDGYILDFLLSTLLICIAIAGGVISLMVYAQRLKHSAQKRRRELAFIDPVTGCYNYNYLRAQSSNILEENNGDNIIVICFDVKHFKFINERLGFVGGNMVLRSITKVISELCEEEVFICRQCNDQFTIIINKDTLNIELEDLITDMIYHIRNIQVGGIDLQLTPSIGVYIVREDDYDITVCVDKADMARSSMKENMNGLYKIYDETLKNRMVKEQELEKNMKEALEGGQFEVYLQPKMDLGTGRLCGAEALVRWNYPHEGAVNPGEFIPLFEKNGFIRELDFFVFDEVNRFIRMWIEHGRIIYPISINLSRTYLCDETFIKDLEKRVEKSGVDTKYLEMEVTESAVLEKEDLFIKYIQKIKEMGFKIAMDDFGSGYSSLNMLKEMPIDILKLDKAFFKGAHQEERTEIIVSKIIEMAHGLGMLVIAEGVESEAQVKFLQKIDCDMIQGFWYGKPMPIKDYELFMS